MITLGLTIAALLGAQDIRLDKAIAGAAAAGETTAAYVAIGNDGSIDDTLIGASCTCAARVELHRVTRGPNGTGMDIDPALAIPAKGRVDIAPPGIPLHLMLIEAKQAMVAGEQVDITLRFARAGPRTARFTIVADTKAGWAAAD